MPAAPSAAPSGPHPADGAVRPVDTVLVTGFLGAGKTTLLSGWLAERPPSERWAVLVNEFGALGVDRALLGGDRDGLAVAEVAGGCACCAARVAFTATLTRLLRRGPWDRLFVETTGLGHPAALVDQLRAPAFATRLRLRPPVAVVDAGRAALYLDSSRPGHEAAADQVVLARLLVLNRSAEPSPPQARALAERLGGLPPWPRPVIATATGTVPLGTVLDALDRVEAGLGSPADARTGADGRAGDADDADDADDAGDAPDAQDAGPGTRGSVAVAPRDIVAPPSGAPDAVRPAAAAHGRPPPAPGPVAGASLPEPLHWRRAEPGAAAAGWWWPAAAAFDRARLQGAFDALLAPGGALRACGLLRGKGVFRTERAWYAWQWVDGRAEWRETAWRADNRLEVLAQVPVDPQMVDEALRTAVAKG